MASNTFWQIAHILCALAQIGLIVVSVAVLISVGTKYAWAGCATGNVTTAFTLLPFLIMRHLRQKPVGAQESDDTRSFNLTTVYRISIFLHIIMFGANIAIAGFEGIPVGDTGALAAILAVACLAGLTALATSLADFGELRQHQSDQQKRPTQYGSTILSDL